VYLGTFSKTLFPSLRIGYVIVPLPLVPAFAKSVEIAGHGPSVIEQAVLHRFIESGSHARHLRQVRSLYDERHAAFCEAMQKRLGGVLRLSGEAMGLRITGELLSEQDDQGLSERAIAANLSLPPLSKYYGGAQATRGFVMGYGHLTTAQIHSGVGSLAAVLRRARRV
jgi:GntR family transcriptional regulator/MocR family aminotransferase